MTALENPFLFCCCRRPAQSSGAWSFFEITHFVETDAGAFPLVPIAALYITRIPANTGETPSSFRDMGIAVGISLLACWASRHCSLGIHRPCRSAPEKLMKRLICLCLLGQYLICSITWATPTYSISGPIGLNDAQHSSPYPSDLNDAGQVVGFASNYVSNGSQGSQGQSAWFYNGATTVRIGLFGTAYTLDYWLYFDHYYGRQNSYITKLNEAGQVLGYSYRWLGAQMPTASNGGGPGYSTWIFDGTSTKQIGIIEPENTDGYGYQYSRGWDLTEAGQAIGYSYRFQGTNYYNGNTGGLTAWFYNGSDTINIGLTGPEYTRSDGYKYSYPYRLNEAGQVSGYSRRYTGSTDLGQTAWLYNGATAVDIGLAGPEYTSDIGSKFSSPSSLNKAGQVSGYSVRYNGGSTSLGQSTWFFNGTTSVAIGLVGPEHTRNDGYRSSSLSGLNEGGQVIGYSARYNGGSASLGQSTWLYNGTTTIETGLTGPEYTRNDGYKSSATFIFGELNEAGQVIGYSARYNGGSTSLGQGAWFFNGTTTVPIGLTGPEHTRNDGYKLSRFANTERALNSAGQVTGISYRYNNGNIQLGQSAWLYNGATTIDIGLTGSEHTRNDGYKYSDVKDWNEAGQTIGYSERYNAGIPKQGQSAWFYNGATTINIGLNDPDHTNFDGYRWSEVSQLNEAGQALGLSYRYVGGSNQLGQDAWLYDPALNQTIPLQLSTLSNGYASSYASYLGEDGLVLGSYELFDALGNDLGSRGFYFTIADGLHDLGSFVNGGLAARGWDYLSSGYLANSHGQIIGTGKLTSQHDSYSRMGYLLTPVTVPEPSTFIFAAAAFGLCLVRSRTHNNRRRAAQTTRRQSRHSIALLTTILAIPLCNTALGALPYHIVTLGFDDTEHTRSTGFQSSSASELNESGNVIGSTARYNGGSIQLGQSAWFYDGSTTIIIGLTGPEHTRNDGAKFSQSSALNEAGQVVGYSYRYNGGSTQLGQSAWLYDGATTYDIGLNDSEFTRNDGYKYSAPSYDGINEAGQVVGSSTRYNGSTSFGSAAWIYNGSATIQLGLIGPEHTRNDGYRSSGASALDEAGHVYGTSQRFNGGSTSLGQSVWFYNGATSTDIGLTSSEYTRNDGYKSSYVSASNKAGTISGVSYRYNSGSSQLGQGIWLFDGANTVQVGFNGSEYTRNDGYRSSSMSQLNQAGRVIGSSERYNGGSTLLGNSAWLYDGANTIQLGYTGSGYTRSDGYSYSFPRQLNEAGRVIGYSSRFNGSANWGNTAWLYDGATTFDIGPTGFEYTGTDGYKNSDTYQLNKAGQVLGTSQRVNGGGASSNLGFNPWLFDGTKTIPIGLTGSAYTKGSGYRANGAVKLNDAGQVIGWTERYNGGYTQLGQDTWFYNGSTTIAIGLTGTEYTGGDGYRYSQAYLLNEAGQVAGRSLFYNGIDKYPVGEDAWFYDPALHQTIRLRLSSSSKGYADSNPTYLGDDGLVLGTYSLYDALDNYLGSRIFSFTVANGLHDLGAMVDGGLAANGWDYLASFARANGQGQILGTGKLTSQTTGQIPYLLTPISVPEPASCTFAVFSLVGVSLLRPRRNP
jgi:hypothetical protein